MIHQAEDRAQDVFAKINSRLRVLYGFRHSHGDYWINSFFFFKQENRENILSIIIRVIRWKSSSALLTPFLFDSWVLVLFYWFSFGSSEWIYNFVRSQEPSQVFFIVTKWKLDVTDWNSWSIWEDSKLFFFLMQHWTMSPPFALFCDWQFS